MCLFMFCHYFSFVNPSVFISLPTIPLNCSSGFQKVPCLDKLRQKPEPFTLSTLQPVMGLFTNYITMYKISFDYTLTILFFPPYFTDDGNA